VVSRRPRNDKERADISQKNGEGRNVRDLKLEKYNEEQRGEKTAVLKFPGKKEAQRGVRKGGQKYGKFPRAAGIGYSQKKMNSKERGDSGAVLAWHWKSTGKSGSMRS